MTPRCALILCGGAGTRLWPLSTEARPKQFLPLIDERSLLQVTYERLSRVVEPESIWIATIERYVPLVLEQIPSQSRARILIEPVRRNTAPAIAMAHAIISETIGPHRLGIFPSDHYIGEVDRFVSALGEGYAYVETEEVLLTLAIPPSAPETGYGYLRLGEPLSGRIRKVEAFIEKPDAETARRYLESGRYAWNGGMFLWESDDFDRSLERHAPEIHALAHEIAVAPSELGSLYQRMPSISIDYAVMEKAENVVTLSESYGWSDVGSWRAVAELIPSSTDGVIRLATDSWIHRASDRLVMVAGADGLIVIDTPESLLIVQRDRDELMREIHLRAEEARRKPDE